MNKTQQNFKKQMQQAEKEQHKSAKKNKGVFTNILFELRFYGYKGSFKKPTSPIISFIIILFKLIVKFLKWLIYIALTLIFIFIIFTIIKK